MAGEEKTGDHEVDETSLADLFSHPFHKLRIAPTATNEEIDEAIGLARERQIGSNAELDALRGTLFSPSLRLSLELSYPIDGAADDVDTIYKMLSSDASTDELLSFSQRLAPLSRATFQAHIAANQSAECTVLLALIESHAIIDPTYAFDILRELRRIRRSPAPSLASVTEGLQRLLTRHCQSINTALARRDNAAETLFACSQQVLDGGERHQIDVLACLLSAYHQSTRMQQAEKLQGIASACRALAARAQPAEWQELARSLTDWTSLCRPLLLFSGHPEALPDFELPLDIILALTRELAANERFDLALELTELSREILSSSSTAIKRLDDSKHLIEKKCVDREMKPLDDFIDRFESNFDPLTQSLKVNGFGSSSVGPAKRLWDLFVQVANATDRVCSAEPWMLVRDLALHLHDSVNEPSAASALMVGLIQHAEAVGAPLSLLDRFRGDLRAVQPKPRILARRPKQIRPNRLIWLAGLAFAALCSAALFLGFEGGERLRLKGASTTALRTANPEIEPPVGTGQHFSLGNVRYCQFQEERLRVMKSLVRAAEDTRAFNLLAVDYNSRCSDFFFRDSDVTAVKAELAVNRQRLANEAEKIMATWPGHSAAHGK